MEQPDEGPRKVGASGIDLSPPGGKGDPRRVGWNSGEPLTFTPVDTPLPIGSVLDQGGLRFGARSRRRGVSPVDTAKIIKGFYPTANRKIIQ